MSMQIKEMFALAQALADVTVVQEYGITRNEKLEIGAKIAKPLVEKLVHDLRNGRPACGAAPRLSCACCSAKHLHVFS
jgi:hypothetical protein